MTVSSDMRMKKPVLVLVNHAPVFIFLLFIIFAGCSAPYIPEEKISTKPVPTETVQVRVAVAKDISMLSVHSKSLSLVYRGIRTELPESITVNCSGTVVTISGNKYTVPVSLVSPGAIAVNGKLYYGHLVIQQGLLIAVVPLDEYLKGVLSSEVPKNWPIEALKAQAVVSRTFVYRRITQNTGRPYDVKNTVMDQKYDHGDGSPQIDRAVSQTTGRVIIYQGKPIEAFFHSCSGGRTESSGDIFQKDLPYLRSVPDPYCKNTAFWSYSLTGDEIKKALQDYISPTLSERNLRAVKIKTRTGSGRAGEFLLVFDGNESIVVNGNSFRIALDPTQFKSLLVDSIRIERKGTDLVFTFRGRGYGHGVGMSQWGAYEMAMRGFKYPAILAHYFRGTKLGFIWDIQ